MMYTIQPIQVNLNLNDLATYVAISNFAVRWFKANGYTFQMKNSMIIEDLSSFVVIELANGTMKMLDKEGNVVIPWKE